MGHTFTFDEFLTHGDVYPSSCSALPTFESFLLAESLKTISPQEAVDRKLFGPVYHGSNEWDEILKHGFKIPKNQFDSRNGYRQDAQHGGVTLPLHHLGFGIYVTTKKSVANQFGGTNPRYTLFIDAPRMETISFGSTGNMMKWWVSNGYDVELAKKDRVAATHAMTKKLAEKYDAVWFKGQGIYKLLDGDQVVVFDPSRIYMIDNKLAGELEVGSRVEVLRQRNTIIHIEKTGKEYTEFDPPVRGIITRTNNIPAEYRQHHNGSDKLYEVKPTKGPAMYNLYKDDLRPLAATPARKPRLTTGEQMRAKLKADIEADQQKSESLLSAWRIIASNKQVNEGLFGKPWHSAWVDTQGDNHYECDSHGFGAFENPEALGIEDSPEYLEAEEAMERFKAASEAEKDKMSGDVGELIGELEDLVLRRGRWVRVLWAHDELNIEAQSVEDVRIAIRNMDSSDMIKLAAMKKLVYDTGDSDGVIEGEIAIEKFMNGRNPGKTGVAKFHEASISTKITNLVPRPEDVPEYYKDKKKATLVTLKDNETILWMWGAPPKGMQWSELLKIIGHSGHEIGIYGKRLLLQIDREFGSWSGTRNSYSKDVRELVRQMMDRGLVKPYFDVVAIHTVISDHPDIEGDVLGKAGDLAQEKELDKIVLYHGTSSERMEGGYIDHRDGILGNGLKPMAVSDRVWKGAKGEKERNAPEHRDDAIYLAANLSTATYYAKKAVKVDRRRGISGSKPVVVQITIPKSDFHKLRADDDHINDDKKNKDPNDWKSSLSYYGQVAYIGTIPVSELKIIEENIAEDIIDEKLSFAQRDKKKDLSFQQAKERNYKPEFDEIWKEIRNSDGVSNEVYGYANYDDNKERFTDETGKDPEEDTGDYHEWLVDTVIKEEVYYEYLDVIGDYNRLDGEKCWRMMTLPMSVDPVKLQGIGVYWAVKRNSADAHWGKFDNRYRKVLFEARIDIDNVDWPGTLFARLDRSIGKEEQEIRFLRHAPVYVYSCTLIPSHFEREKALKLIEINAMRRC